MQVGDCITLELINYMKGVKYRSKIIDINDYSFIVDYPYRFSTLDTTHFIDGTKVRVMYTSRDGCEYYFDTEIINTLNVAQPLLLLQYPILVHYNSDGIAYSFDTETLKKKQEELDNLFNPSLEIKKLRKYTRIPAVVDTFLHSKRQEFQAFTAVTQDVSEGGAAVLVPQSMTLLPNMLLSIILVLPLTSGDTHYIHADSKVVRLIDWWEKKKSIISLQFLNLSDEHLRLYNLFYKDVLGQVAK
ncbi:flagellar brake protein [Bacillus massiliigorillae]|uniref:flagellar brake protein n=1 Tax=Bacillus massiliigorillae TaxID=1243664 RepID=UPI0003A31618|nr:flagellar brake protein [Bacillus massiliigorillae]